MTTRLLLADDHALVRQGLKAFLESRGFQVSCEASNGQEALEMAVKEQPDIAIMDISMPLLNGLDAARKLKKSVGKAKIIMLTKHREDAYVTEALRAGVSGYVLKSQVASDLVHAIQEVCRGFVYLSPGIPHAVINAYPSKSDSPADPLSARERQVLELIGEGKSTKEAAKQLGLSVKTVESHRAGLMRKLDLHETAGLVRYAIRHGLVQP